MLKSAQTVAARVSAGNVSLILRDARATGVRTVCRESGISAELGDDELRKEDTGSHVFAAVWPGSGCHGGLPQRAESPARGNGVPAGAQRSGVCGHCGRKNHLIYALASYEANERAERLKRPSDKSRVKVVKSVRAKNKAA